MTQFFEYFNNSLSNTLDVLSLAFPFALFCGLTFGTIYACVRMVNIFRKGYNNENQQNKTN